MNRGKYQMQKVFFFLLMMFINGNLFAIDFEVNGITYYASALTNTNVKVIGKTKNYTGDIVIPESVSYQGNTYTVTTIGEDAFYGDTDITSIVIPPTIDYIDESAFSNCSNLDIVYITSIESWLNIGFDNAHSNPLENASHLYINGKEVNDIVIPDGITAIDDYAFYSFRGIKSLSLPNTIKFIYLRAFQCCENLELVVSKRATPPSLDTEFGHPFEGISSSAKLIVPKGCIDAYSDWRFYFKEIVEDSSLISKFEIDGIIYNIIDRTNNHVEVTGKSQSYTGTIIIPKTVSYQGISYTVTSIGVNAFWGATDITSIDMPNSVITIEADAFRDCSSLVNVHIPNSVTTIGMWAFQGCSSLTNITIPNSVTTIGACAFSRTALKSIIIPNSITKIDTQTFYYCTGLTNITMPISVTSIEESAFHGCNTLTSIIIPISVKRIAGKAFNSCSSLLSVKSEIRSPFSIKTNVFSGLPTGAELIVPYGTKSKYETTEGWNVFPKITEEDPAQYELNIVAIGNGNVKYDGKTLRNQSQSYSVQEGSSIVLSFAPDTGYRVASVKENNTDVTAAVTDNEYTISNVTDNKTIEVMFEEIPPTIYDLVIKATGSGEVENGAYSVRNKSMTFKVTEGSSVTVSFSPDTGYRLKSVKLDNVDVTSSVVGSLYTISNIKANTTLEVVFEETPPTTYSFSITANGNGTVIYDGKTIKGKTTTFTILEGSYVTVQMSADDGFRLKSVTLNGQDVTKDVVNNQYTTDKITTDVTLIVEFESIPNITDAGVAYTVTSYDNQTVVVAAGNYGNVLTVPASFTAKEKTWTVVGIDENALKDNTALAAVIWNPEVAFTAKVRNPNLLLYVKNAQYAPATIQNVVVNNQAENIVLVEAASGNDFYCPQAFTAKRISYEHNYSMISGYKTCQGWETLVLPFDVTMMINAKGQELTPYSNWQYGNSQRPFWLYEMTTQGWKAGNCIKANTPYVISMPNNEMYDVSFNQTGNIQFIGTNVEVKASTDMTTGQYGNKRLVANYQTQEASADIYALNVSNEWSQNTATEVEGSTFIRSLRSIHPFEAYLTVEGSNAPWAIPIFENLPTGINEKLIVNSEKFATATDWYTIDGRKLQGEPKKAGIYIIKGKKVKK